MIRLSLLETEGYDAIPLSGKDNLITEGDLRHLDPDRLERYKSQQQFCPPHSTGSSSFHPGGIDEDLMPPPLRGRFDRVYFRRRRTGLLWL